MNVQIDSSQFPKPRFPVGTIYKPGTRSECTVCNILYTFDDTGRLIKVRYEATFMHAGQLVKMYDIHEDRIKKYLVSVPESNAQE
jgi:hypothetical protein